MSRTFHHGKRAKARFDEQYGYSNWLRNPGWFNRAFNTGPQRSATRDLLKGLHRSVDLEEAPLFPLARKPCSYYW